MAVTMSKGDSKGHDELIGLMRMPGAAPAAVVPLDMLRALQTLATEAVHARPERSGGCVTIGGRQFSRSGLIERVKRELARIEGDAPFAETEDAADAATFAEARARGEETVPLALAKRLAAGEHPVKVYREHRRLTQARLAERLGVAAGYLSQIETGRRHASRKLLRALASALAVEAADLID